MFDINPGRNITPGDFPGVWLYAMYSPGPTARYLLILLADEATFRRKIFRTRVVPHISKVRHITWGRGGTVQRLFVLPTNHFVLCEVEFCQTLDFVCSFYSAQTSRVFNPPGFFFSYFFFPSSMSALLRRWLAASRQSWTLIGRQNSLLRRWLVRALYAKVSHGELMKKYELGFWLVKSVRSTSSWLR